MRHHKILNVTRKGRIIDWPAPLGFNKKEDKPTAKDIAKFIRWGVKRLKVNPIDFFSNSRKRDLVEARSVLAYTALCMGAKPQQIGEVLERDRVTVINLFWFALKHWGPELEPVGGLLLDYSLWLSENMEINMIAKIKRKARKEGSV